MKVTKLARFIESVVTSFEKYVAREQPQPAHKLLVRSYPEKVSIDSLPVSHRVEYVESKDWSSEIHKFLEAEVQAMEEFTTYAKEIAKEYGQNIKKLARVPDASGQVRFWLEHLLLRVLQLHLEEKLTHEEITEHASRFITELKLATKEFHNVYYLSGITPEQTEIPLTDESVIRRPQDADLEVIRDPLIDTHSFTLQTPSAILEVKMQAEDQSTADELGRRMLQALRLYRLGSVPVLKSVLRRSTVIWPTNQLVGWGGPRYCPFTYVVKAEETSNFTHFVQKCQKLLDYTKDQKNRRSVTVAMERYTSSLLECTDVDRRLMTAVMGLEALYTLPEEPGENAYKLGIRTARLLQNLGFEPTAVNTTVRQAYSLRNKVVHGTYLSQQRKKAMQDMIEDIMNYLRMSIIFAIVNPDKSKVIAALDKSTVLMESDAALLSMLTKFSHIAKYVA